MSVSSSTEIGNLALDLLNAGIVNNIENPVSPVESLLNRWYDQCRRKVLREHPWNFASTVAILAASATANDFGETVYPVPSDFIRLCTVVGSEGQTLSKSEYRFEKRAIVIASDSGQVKIKCIYDITDVNAFDPLFVDLLAYEIAISIAYKVTDSNTNIQRIGELYKMRAAVARAIDGQESPPERREVSRNIKARRMGASTNSHRITY